MDMSHLLCENETYALRGAVFEVYREMGSGFLEPVYQECLQKGFQQRAIPFVAQGELHLAYKGETLEQIHKPDFRRRSPVGAPGRGSGGQFYGAQPLQPTQTRAPTGERLQKNCF